MISTKDARAVLFLVGCMGSRIALTMCSKMLPLSYLPILGLLAVIPAIGFMVIYLTGSRTHGAEVFGERIWWNFMRPIHSMLYAAFAYSAIMKNRDSWIYLFIDTLVGLVAFLAYSDASPFK